MKPLLTLLFVSLSFSVSHSAEHLQTTPNASAAEKSTPQVTIAQIFKRDHPEQKDRDVIVQRIELQPEASAPPHKHPGMVTGYVISGTLEFQVSGEPLLILHEGDTFFEPPGSKHMVAQNPGKLEKTVLVAFVINPKEQATALPLDAPK